LVGGRRDDSSISGADDVSADWTAG